MPKKLSDLGLAYRRVLPIDIGEVVVSAEKLEVGTTTAVDGVTAALPDGTTA